LKPTDIYLDIGANIGTTFIPAAKVVTAGQAIGFEPHPQIFAYLQENVALNNISQHVMLHNCALGGQNGHITFSDKKSDDQNQILVNDSGLNVPINRLDDLTTAYDRIDLIKVDVEGYEKFVFEGAADTLAKTACIYYEVCDAYFERFGYTTRDLLAILAASGFKQFQRRGGKTLRAIDSHHLTAPEPTNLIAIRDVEAFIRRTGWRIVD
jgi:FkbM family methyltransferase